MQTTKLRYKLLPSLINVGITFLIALPFYFIFTDKLWWKYIWILVFLVYNLVFEIIFNRCPGMMLVGSHYNQNRNLGQKILYVILYSLSFSTLLFRLWFPFDLFLINLLLIQLPFILITKTTFHGYLSGKIKTVR
jgi:hypothetical protein